MRHRVAHRWQSSSPIAKRQRYVDDEVWYPLAALTAIVGGGVNFFAPFWVAMSSVLIVDVAFVWFVPAARETARRLLFGPVRRQDHQHPSKSRGH
jgi:hypothetical protein